MNGNNFATVEISEDLNLNEIIASINNDYDIDNVEVDKNGMKDFVQISPLIVSNKSKNIIKKSSKSKYLKYRKDDDGLERKDIYRLKRLTGI